MIRRTHLTKEKYCAFFCVIYFFISDLSRLLAGFGMPRPASYAVFLVMFALYIINTRPVIKAADLLIGVSVCIVTIYGLIENASYISNDTNLFVIIIVFLPSYYFFSSASEEHLSYGLKYASIFSGVYLIAYYFLIVRSSNLYDMSYSGWTSVPTCILFYYYLKEKKIMYLAMSVVLFVTSFISGSRSGPLLSLVCCMYFLLIELKDNKIARVAVIGVGLFVILLRNNLTLFVDRLSSLSVMSRNMRKLMSGDLLVSRPREALYNRVRSFISAQPLGYGPLASRRILTGEPYPHSLFYELQLDYGVYLGIPLFIAICIMAIYLLIKKRNAEEVPLIGTLCIVGLGTLMVSSSYFHGYTVTAIIALFVKAVYKRKENIYKNI